MLKKFFFIAACCVLVASSAAAAQQANEVEMGNAIRKGVDQRVDQRVDDRLSKFGQQQKCADWSKCSAQDRLSIAVTICGDDWKSSWEADDLKKAGYDKLSRRDFYAKIGQNCTLTNKVASTSDPRVIMAPEDEDDDIAVIEQDAPVRFAQTYVNADVTIGRPGYGRGLSAADNAALRGIAQRALGPLPADARAYTAHVTRTAGAPASGCRQVSARRADGGIFKRWQCPRGTINRLGW